MALVKTETGREALQKRDRLLNPRARQILVIADGTRSREQMVALLGDPAGQQIDHLLQMGFLKSKGDAPVAAPRLEARATVIDTRRSLVATKVYCIDMLQLLREPESASVIAAIRASDSEAELMENVFLCLRYVYEKTAGTYAAKVADRLAEIIPQPYVSTLDEWRVELQAQHQAA